MAEQIIKDKLGRKIAVLKDKTNGETDCFDAVNRKRGTIKAADISGKRAICDSMNRKLGVYDSKKDVTLDGMNRQIGKGNLALALLGLL